MNTAEIELTSSQQALLPKMEAFLNSSERIFLLTGKPGVGKTTMTKIVLAAHIAADEEGDGSMNVAGITLAHQAKNVLGEHIPNVFTFAKAFGMKETIDKRTGKRTFEYDKYASDVTVGKMNIPVFVHDEVSQYTQEMLDIVLENTPIFSKIIMIGDMAQLPPIDPENKMGPDADSPIFSYDIPESCKHELTERVRQAQGNPILELSDVIREEIFGGQNLQRVIQEISTPVMKNGIGYSFVRYNEFLEHIEKRDIMETRVLAYRNKTINLFNPQIRGHMLGFPQNMIIEGDIVTMTENYYKFEGGSNYPKYVLYNSETFRLGKVYTSVMAYSTDVGTYRFDVYIADVIDDSKEKREFVTPTEDGWRHYEEALEEIADLCRARKIKWEQFWNLKKKFCHYAYGYCSSVYKAQGSSYDSIYLDINDILMTGPLTPKRKLQAIYTAITRARFDVYFLKS